MAGPARVKGSALSLEFGTPAVDYRCDATSVVLENEEADTDVVTFCDAAEGGSRQYFFTITAIQSTQADSFWRYAWDNVAEEIPFTYAPHGNLTPSEDQPHIVGTVKVGPRPSIGGEAGASNTFTFETRWDVVGTPELVTV